jgi:hypothetical protein
VTRSEVPIQRPKPLALAITHVRNLISIYSYIGEATVRDKNTPVHILLKGLAGDLINPKSNIILKKSEHSS